MKACFKLRLFAILGTLVIGNVRAEYCDMVGCAGNIGYIRIPAGQIDRAQSQTIKINNKTYTIDDSTLLFNKPGLPEPSETVVLNRRSSLASNWNPKSPIDLKAACGYAIDNSMKAIDYEINDSTKIAKLHQYWDDFGGGLMSQGSVIKILKYATCKIDGTDAHFALVEVIKD